MIRFLEEERRHIRRFSSDPVVQRLAKRLDGVLDELDELQGKRLERLIKQLHDVLDEAGAENAPASTGTNHTDAAARPDVDLVVREAKRVVEVWGTTTFQIRLRNYGTKDATNLQVNARLSPTLEVLDAGGVSKDVNVGVPSDNGHKVVFSQINKLGPGKEMVLGIRVRAVGDRPSLATCKVAVTYDNQTVPLEDMAGVKVKTSRPAAAESTSGNQQERQFQDIVTSIEEAPIGRILIPVR